MDAYPETPLRLVERRHEYGGVYTYAFAPENPVLYEAGQYGHVRLFGLPEGEKPVREFSFASAPSDAEIVFGVDARSWSAYQKALQALPVGGHAGLFKIKGHMAWPPAASSVVMIAGGIGITPFRSMLRDAAHKELPLELTLIHASRDEFLYAKECEALSTYIRASRETLPKSIAEAAAAHPHAQYYVAGSSGFVETTSALLAALGITAVQTDAFKGLADESAL